MQNRTTRITGVPTIRQTDRGTATAPLGCQYGSDRCQAVISSARTTLQAGGQKETADLPSEKCYSRPGDRRKDDRRGTCQRQPSAGASAYY